jgi:hypothetical protein
VKIRDTIKSLVRRRPVTEEELAARAEAKLVRDQMLQDRVSQETGAGQVYRSGRR